MNCDYTLGIACGFRRLQLILTFRDKLLLFATMAALPKTLAKIVLKRRSTIKLIWFMNTFERLFLRFRCTNSKFADSVSLLWKTKLVFGRGKNNVEQCPILHKTYNNVQAK